MFLSWFYEMWIQTDFRLVIVFSGLFSTTRGYTFQFTIIHDLVLTVTSSVPLLCSGFQWRPFTFQWVSERFR